MSKKLNVSGLFSSEPLEIGEEARDAEKELKKTADNLAKGEDKKVEKKGSKPPKIKKEATAKVVEDMPSDEEWEEVGEGEGQAVGLLPGLNKIKKKKPIEYISFKLKRDLHNKLAKIAKKENVDYMGNLVHLILEDFVKKYEGK